MRRFTWLLRQRVTAAASRWTEVCGSGWSLAALAALVFAFPAIAAAQRAGEYDRGTVALESAIRALGTTGRVLLIGAHPDDEDSPLIAWLSRGHHVETAYLSLTRGESGQNYLGGERSDALGVIRTEEVLAARRLDGAHQYFTRAFDFGFSKSAEETLQHWPRDTVMGDVMRVVRAFRPHVIVALHGGTSRDMNGQHQVAGLLAHDAWAASTDTVRYPIEVFGAPWAVGKLYRAGSVSGPVLVINVGAFDAVVGRSNQELAADARSLHKSQGLALPHVKGVVLDTLSLEAFRDSDAPVNVVTSSTGSRTPPEATPPNASLFDGIDTTWARLRARTPREDVQRALDSAALALVEVRRLFRPEDPSPLVAPLAHIIRWLRVARDSAGTTPWRLVSGDEVLSRTRFVDARSNVRADIAREAARGNEIAAGSPAEPELWQVLERMIRLAERALLLAAAVEVEALAPRSTFPVIEPQKTGVPDSLPVSIAVFNRGRAPVHVVKKGEFGVRGDSTTVIVAPDSAWQFARALRSVRISTQWWRLTPRADAWYDKTIDARDERARSVARTITTTVTLDIGGIRLPVTVPVLNRQADPVKGEQFVPVGAVPGIVIGLPRGLEYIRANVPVTRALHVRILSAYQSAETVTVSVPMLPAGLKVDSAQRVRVLTPEAPGADVVFLLSGRLTPQRYALGAVATHRGVAAGEGYYTVNYDHITPQRMYAPSSMWLQAVDVTLPPRAIVGYVTGTDDDGADALLELDVPVERIEPAAVPKADLSRFASIVIGPRVYATTPALAVTSARLLDYVKRGGTLVVQYGQSEMTKAGVMPWPIQFGPGGTRVADERSPVTVLAPRARSLNVPNRIVADDWANWVVERASYLPREFDQHYTPLIEMHDADEPVNRAGLLVARYGKGTYVYAPLALHRQLSAGIPGAARLFLNLITPATPSAR